MALEVLSESRLKPQRSECRLPITMASPWRSAARAAERARNQVSWRVSRWSPQSVAGRQQGEQLLPIRGEDIIEHLPL